jgi:hypothetical protein
MPESPGSTSQFDVARKWIVGLTSVLVVIPALVNGGIDIYSSLAKLPKSEAERTNVALFKKYFNKQPVATFPVPIRQSNGTVEVRFAVYEEGDVFVEFGKFTQWFPFPSPDRRSGAFAFVGEAVAQTAAVRGHGTYQQVERVDGNALVRERTFQNGVTERYRLDPRTGEVLEFSAQRSAAATAKPPPAAVSAFAPIDLDALRANRAAAPGTASICATQIGSCQMYRPVAAKSPCSCAGPNGAVPGVAK